MTTIATFTAHQTANTNAATVLVVEDAQCGWFYVYVEGRALFEQPITFDGKLHYRQQFATRNLREALQFAAGQVQAALEGK